MSYSNITLLTEYRRRVEIIQDFEFPSAANIIRMSPDGRFIGTCGTYKPRIKMYETEHLSLKFERYCDAEVVAFSFLTDDFSKFLAMRNDRTLEIHAQGGLHQKVRFPCFARDILYHRSTCDTYVVGSQPEAYRINLEQGCFLAPLATSLPSINAIASNDVHPILALAGDDGRLECWDPRDRTRACVLDIPASVADMDQATFRAFKKASKGVALTAAAFDASGLQLAVGTNTGHALLYDIRAGAPHLVKDHRYGLPIKKVLFHTRSNKLLTIDSKITKIWELSGSNQGELHTSIQPSAFVNDATLVGDSGMIMYACETKRMQVYYAPSLGPVPDWCAHLEGLTEEMEETSSATGVASASVYDDYMFVSKDQLEDWGVSSLIGTKALRPYMHGYYMDAKLYERVKAIAEPDDYKSYVAEQVKRKIDEQRENRISVKAALPKVNAGKRYYLICSALSIMTWQRNTDSILLVRYLSYLVVVASHIFFVLISFFSPPPFPYSSFLYYRTG